MHHTGLLILQPFGLEMPAEASLSITFHTMNIDKDTRRQ